jgi:uncharacterized protein (TIRG00374 family)
VRRTAVVLGTNLVLGGAALAWLLWRYGGPALELLARAPSWGLLVAVVATVATGLAVDALRWRTLLAGVVPPPGLARLTAFRAAGQSVSALVPSARLGGEPLRMYLLARDGVAGPVAIASVVVDRTLEMGASTALGCLFAFVLVRAGVPQLGGALVTMGLVAASLVAGVAVTVRRLRRRAGLVTAMARITGLARVGAVARRLGTVAAAEEVTSRLAEQPRRLGSAFGIGFGASAVVLGEFALLLAAFGLPHGPLAVVGAVFAVGAAHALPVPGAVGTLEGGTMWMFRVLGYPPEVALAAGLAARLRELCWLAPGLVWLAVNGRSLVRDVRGSGQPASARPRRSRVR